LRKRLQVRCLRQQFRELPMLLSMYLVILPLWMRQTQLTTYRSSQAKVQALSLVPCMTTRSLMNVLLQSLLQVYIMWEAGHRNLKQGWKDSRKKWDPFFRPGIHRLEAILTVREELLPAGRREVQCLHFSRELRQAR